MSKKLLFSAYSMDIGGIETALLTLVNELKKRGYDITICLERKQGIFLDELEKTIKVIEYRPNESKNIIIRKAINMLKRVKFNIKYNNKFDFSASYATYSKVASFVARTSSKNSYLWAHADYLTLFNNNVDEMKSFFEEIRYNKFKKIIFVSNEGKNSFIKVFPELKNRVIVSNNLINSSKIIELSNEKIETEKEENIITFINVGRHDEKQKKLTRIIEAAKMLKDNNYRFRILFVGSGPDTEFYKSKVKEKELEDTIIFLGRKKNPYPYYKISDCVLLSSEYEGYPVVFLESFVLNKPLITTKVSDYEEVEDKFGYVTEKNVDDIYDKMRIFIENGFDIKEKFVSSRYNEDIIMKIEKLIEGENS